MFKLIRDNIPDLMKKSGEVCNYATVENDELFIALLRNKLVEEVNEFLRTGAVDELTDIRSVIDALARVNGLSEKQFDELCANKLATNGGFDKKYMGLFPDPVAEQPKE